MKYGNLNFSLDTIAQLSHFGWGLALVWGWYLALGRPWWGFAAVVAFATVKEAVIDVWLEDAQTRGSGLRDWIFWTIGAVVAQLALLWEGRI